MFEKRNKKSHDKEQVKQAGRALSVSLVRDESPDRTYFISRTINDIGHFLFSQTQELYKAITLAFSLDAMDWHSFRRYIWPVATSGAALVLGEYLTRGMSQYQTESDDYDFVYKFLIGAAVLSCSALHRITDKRFASTTAFSAAVASEVVAITYMFSSVFTGTHYLTRQKLSEDYSLIASIGTSALLVPGSISYATQKLQQQLLKWQHGRGAQRSDTAAIPSGLTSIANFYFQLGHIIAQELMPIPRLFQLGLIADNILHAQHAMKQFRNVPALFADLTPATIKEVLIQQAKIQHDYEYNHKYYQVLKFTADGTHWASIPGYQLRTGDLVFCNAAIDLSSVTVSGELVALKKGERGQFLAVLEQKKFGVNLKAQNGEDVWIEQCSKTDWRSSYDTVDLHRVRDGKQPGVMVGDKLNLFGADNFFIQIKPEQEFLLANDTKQVAVINQIIAERKRKSVLHSVLASTALGLCLQRDVSSLPAAIATLMFTVFQTMIPFSENFLRETVNGQLLKELNKNLGDRPFDTIGALRIVDLCNALSGYYDDRFPQGVAIISDKTGTLTTASMDVLGMWTSHMPSNVQELIKEKEQNLMPSGEPLGNAFEIFCQAYTNNPKEMEPEEHAILQVLTSLAHNQKANLTVHVLGNNHFRKVLSLNEMQHEVETVHLGLYRRFGGRLTLVKDKEGYSLIFCGIPKADAFKDTSLFHDYYAMQPRTGVLSRDWCIAQAELSEHHFNHLNALFEEDNKSAIESFLTTHHQLLENLKHQGTFIIDNPVKKGAEKFIGQCRSIDVPVFVATGDTIKAAENIANVLCPEYAQNIITLRAEHMQEEEHLPLDESHLPANSTVIFAGINASVLSSLHTLLSRPKSARPVIIFAEMSTEGKGILARFLRDKQFFLVANGDGSNDVMMMKEAHTVIAHSADDGSFAPGVGVLANLMDVQLRRLLGSKQSFYELFELDNVHHSFRQYFVKLANSQEKPSLALALKSSKMSFDLAQSVLGREAVKEMQQQHWFSVGFDLTWLWIAFYEIIHSAELPMDNQNISASNFITQSMGIAMLVAAIESLVNYGLFGESTNFTSMLLMLMVLPIVLKSVFSSFQAVQDTIYPAPELLENTEDKQALGVVPRRSWWGSMSTFFKSPRSICEKQGEFVSIQELNNK